MPLSFLKNQYKASEIKRLAWFENPDDPGAYDRVYGSSSSSPASKIPYYHYPAFTVTEVEGNTKLVPHEKPADFQQYQTELTTLCNHLMTLSNQLQLKDAKEHINKFREALLCGFTGETGSKYAQQDAILFAQMKQNLETLVNAMLRNPSNCKETMQRIIYAISVCEGGAYADLDVMAKALNPSSGIFGVLQDYRVNVIEGMAYEHLNANNNSTKIPQSLHTHVNMYLQEIGALYGLVPAKAIDDQYIPSITRSNNPLRPVVFTRNEAKLRSLHSFLIDQTYINDFKKEFDKRYLAHIIDRVAMHLYENIVLLYQEYEASIDELLKGEIGNTRAEREASLKEQYKKDPQPEMRIRMQSINVDAEARLKEKVTELLRQYDAPGEAYGLLFNEKAGEKPTLKAHQVRLSALRAIAEHCLKKNEVLTGFQQQPIPGTDFFLCKDENDKGEWVENDEGEMLTAEQLIAVIDLDDQTVFRWLLENSTLPFLFQLKEALKKIFLLDENDETIVQIDNAYDARKLKHNLERKEGQDYLFETPEDLIKVVDNNGFTLPLFEYEGTQDILKQMFSNPDKYKNFIESMLAFCFKHSKAKDLIIQLFQASAKGNNQAIVKTFLNTSYGAKLARKEDGNGNTLLQWNAAEGRKDIVKLFLEMGYGEALAKHQDIKGMTALHFAAANGREDIVRMFLATKYWETLAKQKDTFGHTALYWAARNGHTHLVQVLSETEYGKTLAENEDKYGINALHWAIVKGYRDIVQSYLAQNYGEVLAKQRDKKGNTALHLAAAKGDLEVVLMFLSKKYGLELAFQKNRSGYSALSSAHQSDSCVNALIIVGGKSLVATDPPVNLAMFKYTRAGFIADPNRHKLLMQPNAGLDALFNDLGLNENYPEKVYLYAFAFKGYAHEKSVFKNHDRALILERFEILLELVDKQLHKPSGAAPEDLGTLQATLQKLIEALEQCQTIINRTSLTSLGAPSWASTLFRSKSQNMFDEVPAEIRGNLPTPSRPTSSL